METMTERSAAERIEAGIADLQEEISALRAKYPRAVARLSSLIGEGAARLNGLVGVLGDDELTKAAVCYIDGLPICGNCIALVKDRLGLVPLSAGVTLPSIEEIIAARTWF